ncbi:hypothetical protein HanRHA438_Chr10g0440361 [Helianthus annuus]|nr:hypothetical protein HanRHA438_Chr10g0440361 [Helianthus annuus]
MQQKKWINTLLSSPTSFDRLQTWLQVSHMFSTATFDKPQEWLHTQHKRHDILFCMYHMHYMIILLCNIMCHIMWLVVEPLQNSLDTFSGRWEKLNNSWLRYIFVY